METGTPAPQEANVAFAQESAGRTPPILPPAHAVSLVFPLQPTVADSVPLTAAPPIVAEPLPVPPAVHCPDCGTATIPRGDRPLKAQRCPQCATLLSSAPAPHHTELPAAAPVPTSGWGCLLVPSLALLVAGALWVGAGLVQHFLPPSPHLEDTLAVAVPATLVVLLPLLVIGLSWGLKLAPSTTAVEGLAAWAQAVRAADAPPPFLRRWLAHPQAALLHAAAGATEGLEPPHLRAGVRLVFFAPAMALALLVSLVGFPVIVVMALAAVDRPRRPAPAVPAPPATDAPEPLPEPPTASEPPAPEPAVLVQEEPASVTPEPETPPVSSQDPLVWLERPEPDFPLPGVEVAFSRIEDDPEGPIQRHYTAQGTRVGYSRLETDADGATVKAHYDMAHTRLGASREDGHGL